MPYEFKTIKVSVSKTNIFRGVPTDGTSCAIALAVNDLFPVPGYGSAVDRIFVKIFKYPEQHKCIWKAELPKSAVRFVDKFDCAKTKKERLSLNPFTFQLTFTENKV